MDELRLYRKSLVERFASVGGDLAKVVGDVVPTADADPTRLDYLRKELAHLRNAEANLFMPCLRKLLEEENPILDCASEETGSLQNGGAKEGIEMLLLQYLDLRGQASDIIRTMQEEAWSRSGLHPRWGERTLQWWVEKSLAHAEEHLAQMQENLGPVPQTPKTEGG